MQQAWSLISNDSRFTVWNFFQFQIVDLGQSKKIKLCDFSMLVLFLQLRFRFSKIAYSYSFFSPEIRLPDILHKEFLVKMCGIYRITP